jgi:hypothetical protein
VAYGEATARHALVADVDSLLALLRGALETDQVGLLPEPVDVNAIEGPDATTTTCERELQVVLRRFFRNGEDADGDGVADSIDSLVRVEARLPGALPFNPGANTYGALAPQVNLLADMPRDTLMAWDAELVAGRVAADAPALVDDLAQGLAERACAQVSAGARPLVAGQPVPFYVDAQGRDLRQLLNALGEVAPYAWAQALLTDAALEGPARELEHAWDLAYGAFGASVVDAQRSAQEVAETPAVDIDGNVFIDPTQEVTLAAAGKAAGADARSCTGTRLLHDTLDALLLGRATIAAAGQRLSARERDAVLAARDDLLRTWEQVLTVTVLRDLSRLIALLDEAVVDPAGYSVQQHASHWARARGRLQGLQFGPWGRDTRSGLGALLRAVGSEPVLAPELFVARRAALVRVRDTLAAAHDWTHELGDLTCGWR